MGSLVQNLRFALRQLRKSPGFTVTVVVTLALGIGANAAVFTLFDQVLLRMLPVEKPQQLVRFEWTGSFSGSASSFGGNIDNYFSYPMYQDLRDRNQVFSGILAADRTGVGVTWQNQADDVDAEIVSGNYFQVLGLSPAMGRLLTPQDDTAKDGNPEVVLGYDYWRSRFAGTRDVVGQTALINGHPFTIVGVAPENFESAIGGYKPGVFVPMSMADIAMPFAAPRKNQTNHLSLWLTLVARLKPGVTATQAEASLAPLWHALRAQEITLYKSTTPRFVKSFTGSQLQVKDDSRGFTPERTDLKTPLIILMSMAGLLVAMCAINVATLLLLRAAGRAREMSMRYALGAKRGRIVGQLLVEGGMIGAAGALAGIVLAPAVTNTLVQLMIHADPGNEPYSASVDGRMLLFTLGVAVAASLIFSIAPVFHFLRPNLAEALRQNTGTLSKDSQRFRKFAVGAQIAVSVVLLGGAGLFVRTLDNLRGQNVGFEATHLATFELDPTSSGYGEANTPQIIVNALETLRKVPGAVSVAATTDPELTGDSAVSGFNVEGYKQTEDDRMDFEEPWTTPGYFATLRQPLLAGRDFTEADAKGAPKVAIVNASMAKKYFGSPQNAVGHMVGEGPRENPVYDTRIVGVVGDVKHQDLRTDMGPAVYRPYLQQPHPSGVQIYVRTAVKPEAVEVGIRKAMHEMNPMLVVDGLRTMQEEIDRVAADERALAILATGFSALALVLAGVGLYGVLAYSTEQRTREIGVRLALGAQRLSIVLAVVREMAVIAAIAVIVALPSIVALARLFRSQLYEVTTFDPLALAAALGVTVAMVLLAAALPAQRAAAVEPMQALRTE